MFPFLTSEQRERERERERERKRMKGKKQTLKRVQKGGRRTPSVSSRVGSLPLYADVRLNITMTHRDDAGTTATYVTLSKSFDLFGTMPQQLDRSHGY